MESKPTVVQRALEAWRADGWFNALTGLGTLARDRSVHTTFEPGVWLDDQTLSNLFHHDDICNRVVSIYPSEALRNGFKITGPHSEELTATVDRLKLSARIQEAATWGRLYGGAIAVLGPLDGDPKLPLDTSRPQAIRWIDVYDKRDVTRGEIDRQQGSPTYMQAITFRVTPSNHVEPFEVHRSRCLVFGGPLTATREKESRGGWDMSVLQIVLQVIQSFNNSYLATNNMLTDASQAVIKMKGLLSSIAGNYKDLATRAQILDLTRSIARAVLLDADANEEFTKVATSFADVPDLMDRFASRLAAATRIPVTKLMGQAPAGLNATGDSDVRNWYDEVASYRSTEIEPHFARILHLLAPAERHTIEWLPLWQPTPKEKAETRKLEADTDAIYLDRDVVLPEEVAQARFGSEGWKERVEVDMSLRRAIPANAPKDPIPVTPADVATVLKVNALLAMLGQPPIVGPDGDLTVAEYQAKNASKIAAANAATSGEPVVPASPAPQTPAPPPKAP